MTDANITTSTLPAATAPARPRLTLSRAAAAAAAPTQAETEPAPPPDEPAVEPPVVTAPKPTKRKARKPKASAGGFGFETRVIVQAPEYTLSADPTGELVKTVRVDEDAVIFKMVEAETKITDEIDLDLDELERFLAWGNAYLEAVRGAK